MRYLLETPHNNYEAGKELLHAGTDTKEMLEVNRKRFGDKWYWYDKNITYNFNKEGYRMDKEVSEVDFNNYYAFFGCSYTVGAGLPLEETFVHRIATAMNVDYVNGATVGASVEFVLNNITQLLTTAKNIPKCIVINWPELSRTMYWEDNKIQFMLPNSLHTIKNHWSKAYEAFVMEESNINNRFDMIRKQIQLLCNQANIKLFEFTTHQSDPEFFKKYLDIHTMQIAVPEFDKDVSTMHLNKARDTTLNFIAHPGLHHQNQIVESFLKHYEYL
jgi:hypothetical protein